MPEPSPPDAPTIQIYSPTDGAIYLSGMQVGAFYQCSSYTSYVISCQGDVPLGAPLDVSSAGTHTFTVRAVDLAGRTTTKSVTYQVPDLIPPQVDLRAPRNGARYELGAAVTIDYSCADPGGTGISYCAGERPSGAPLDTTRPGTRAFTVYAVDGAGNLRVETANYTVIAPPLVKIASPANGATYTLGSPVLASYACWNAAGTLNVGCTGTVENGSALDTGTVGAKSFTANADENGSRTSLTHTYDVVYAFGGFSSPVSTAGAIDGAKAGDSIPLKFSLGGDQGLGIVVRTTWQLSSCADWSGLAAAATGEGRLSYNSAIDRYTDHLATDKSWNGSCRIIDLQLADGTHHPVRVRFR